MGKATTELFCHSGAKVAVWDVNESRGKDLVKALSDQGHSVIFMKVDTSSDTQVRQAVQDTLVHFGRIDILVIF
ncbi:MAG: SDR family oxidoreductase [Saprospiraceae bacterium]|nr:SDR family oxidoreductase [Saprospiraceae bacterium]